MARRCAKPLYFCKTHAVENLRTDGNLETLEVEPPMLHLVAQGPEKLESGVTQKCVRECKEQWHLRLRTLVSGGPLIRVCWTHELWLRTMA